MSADDNNSEIHLCQYAGCEAEGYACWLPEPQAYIEIDGQQYPLPDEWLCGEHRPLHGYCSGCGDFWGGIETFELSGLCDGCQAELDHEWEQEDADFDEDWEEWDDMPNVWVAAAGSRGLRAEEEI